MNSHEPVPVPSRRTLMKQGVGLGIGVMLVSFAREALSDTKKVSKEAVGYSESVRMPGQDCDDCANYIAAASRQESPTCKLVEGPISPHGHCRAFMPATKK
jgi:hypothetical protein